jgi:hypothetical protein
MALRVMANRPQFLELADARRLPVWRRWRPKRLEVLLLADDRHVANVVRDHIEAFMLHSQHAVRVVNPIHTKVTAEALVPMPDVILVHYSLLILSDYFFPAAWRELVKAFPGAKAQIIQDEHRSIDAMKARMAELGIGAVLSSLEVANLPKVYGGDATKGMSFYSCLPGYMADNFNSFTPPPIADRPLDVVYRGRELLYRLGRGAREKSLIGEQMLAVARRHGLKVDISSKEESRIYKQGWIEFLMSGRATLGVEGGVTIFHFDDAIERATDRYLEAHPGAGFEEVWQAVLAPHEGNVVHRTITPKLFEAIATKTALVLYPGRYRGILQADRHYIPFERDGSNAAEVVAKIKDTAFLQDLVDRTHAELIGREDLSARFYVGQVDLVLSRLHHELAESAGSLAQGGLAALASGIARQAITDQAEQRAAAALAAEQARIEQEHAAFVAAQQDELRRVAEEAAARQAEIERQHAQYVAAQQLRMREEAEAARAKHAEIERAHAEFVHRQEEEMQRDVAAASARQAEIDRAHAEYVSRQEKEMHREAAAAAARQAEIDRAHAEYVARQKEEMRRAAEEQNARQLEAARRQAEIDAEHTRFVQSQLEEMRLAAEAAAREQAKIEAEHAAYVARQQEEMARAAAEAAEKQAQLEAEHAAFVRAQQEAMRRAVEEQQLAASMAQTTRAATAPTKQG